MSIKLQIAGPFTLKITFSLTKDGREEVGNLLDTKSREYTQSFESIHQAIEWLEVNTNRISK